MQQPQQQFRHQDPYFHQSAPTKAKGNQQMKPVMQGSYPNLFQQQKKGSYSPFNQGKTNFDRHQNSDSRLFSSAQVSPTASY
jgi:hypothetical protein